jgi:hypothetical protein
VLFQEKPAKGVVVSDDHVGQQDSLTQIIDTAAASGVEIGNGKN